MLSSSTPPPTALSFGDLPPLKRGRVTFGAQFGSYYTQEELGAGGMATVYKTFDQQRRELVALKMIRPHLAKQPDVARRFR